jgi:signal transduction histidine kinase
MAACPPCCSTPPTSPTSNATAPSSARTRGANSAQLEQGVFDRARAVQDANLALDSQRRQLMALFAQAPGFMAVLRGPEYVFEIANAAYEELIANENIVGRRIADVLPEIVDQGYMELLDQVRLTGRRFVGRGMRVQLARAGELAPRYVDFIYQPIVDETGEVAAIFVQGADVTDREMLVAALRESERALRDADLRKDRFLATLAHELRNPLAPIGTAAALLQVASDTAGARARSQRDHRSAGAASHAPGQRSAGRLARHQRSRGRWTCSGWTSPIRCTRRRSRWPRWSPARRRRCRCSCRTPRC